jgi:hypothetical protein
VLGSDIVLNSVELRLESLADVLPLPPALRFERGAVQVRLAACSGSREERKLPLAVLLPTRRGIYGR